MSQANIPNITPLISVTVGQTIPLLLSSIALEELALAHIVNAEAEKLQLVLGTLPGGTPLSPAVVSISDLLAVDASVQTTLRDVIKKEMLLEFKFENTLDLLTGITTPGGISIPPVTGAECGVPTLISGALFGALGLPIVGAQVNLEVIASSPGASLIGLPPTTVTGPGGIFSVLVTPTGAPGPNFVTIRASVTIAGVTVFTDVTIEFECPIP